jgi:hypothetical protein
MKPLLLLTLLLLVPVVEAQAGRVATDYIRVVTQPAFQYRSDQEVSIPMQARIVKGGVPQPGLVHFEVRAQNGTPLPVPGGQEDWRGGVAPYPHTTDLNLGRLEPGLYRVTVHLWGGGLERDWGVEFDVVYPPQPYSATLLGADGHGARFVFQAHDPRDQFTLTVYRDGEAGAAVLQRVTTNATTLRVPYVPGQAVKITVTDPHGWQNSENEQRDATGAASYPAYVWNPDYKQIENYQRQSWMEELTAGAVLVVLVVLLVMVRRRA